MKVAVIGAGVSGLGAIKTCLEEGLSPECFEVKDGLGGVWNYLPTPVEGQPSVIWSTVSSTCKETNCFSDFPYPDDFPNFLHHPKVIEYLKLYAKNFDLERYIHYRTEVIEIVQTEDFQSSGQWTVKTKDLTTGKESTKVFDAVMMCNGHHSDTLMPEFEGSAEFQGRQLHSHLYRSSKEFEGKRVLIVGFSDSAADIAVELAHVCSQVYMSTGRGAWILPRTIDGGLTADSVVNRRSINCLPNFIKNRLFSYKLNSILDHSLYGIEPQHFSVFQQPLLNDVLHTLLASHRVIVKPRVTRLTKTGVVFEDQSVEEDIDAIIYATGYNINMSSIKHPSYRVRDGNLIDLYKFVFAPDVKPHTMAVIGCVQPPNSVFPITEIQCRWAAAVFKGEAALPSEAKMKSAVNSRRQQMIRQFDDTPRYTTGVQWINYQDEIAEEIGCKPNWMRILMSDPRLAMSIFFGQCTPTQYRLQGRHQWPRAREVILTKWNRMVKGFQGHNRFNRTQNKGSGIPLLGLAAIVIYLVFFLV